MVSVRAWYGVGTGKHFKLVFLSVAVIIALGLGLLSTFVRNPALLQLNAPFQQRLRPSPIAPSPRDYAGPGQCFSPRIVRWNVPCAKCVHFITIAKVSGRWSSFNNILRGLHASAGAVRASHKCSSVHVYTNVRRNSPRWSAIARAGGGSVKVVPLPTDLPRNAYSGKNGWMELSRHKLDLLERYEKTHGRKAIWFDLDTIIATDLSCAYARAPNFVVSRRKPGHALLGPNGTRVTIHPRRSTFGDLFMVDANLIGAVRKLESSGMPPPTYDLQDYFSFLMNRCDGSLVDIRAILRAGGFARGGRMCFGFDFSDRKHPDPALAKLKMLRGRLHCGIRTNGTVTYHPVGALSFVAKDLWAMLDKPEGYFRTPQLREWAKTSGIIVKGSQRHLIGNVL